MHRIEAIGDRINEILDEERITASAFSKILGYDKPQSIYDFIKKKCSPGYDFFQRFCSSPFFGLYNIDYLITGNGSLKRTDTACSRILSILAKEGMTVTQYEKNHGMIKGTLYQLIKNSYSNPQILDEWATKLSREFPQYSTEWILFNTPDASHDTISEAIASIPLLTPTDLPLLSREGLSVDSKPKYHVYEFKDADFLFRMSGDSMAPTLHNGDLVACKIQRVSSFWQWRKIYLICIEDNDIIVCRIGQPEDGDGVICISDNSSYPPFSVDVEKITFRAMVLGGIFLV